jgi:hypothetical protein
VGPSVSHRYWPPTAASLVTPPLAATAILRPSHQPRHNQTGTEFRNRNVVVHEGKTMGIATIIRERRGEVVAAVALPNGGKRMQLLAQAASSDARSTAAEGANRRRIAPPAHQAPPG